MTPERNGPGAAPTYYLEFPGCRAGREKPNRLQHSCRIEVMKFKVWGW